MRRGDAENDWSVLQISAGLLGILLCGPGLLLAFVPGLHDMILGDNPLVRLGLSWPYLATFGGLFVAGIVSLIIGVRGATRPPSVLYHMTHPRLPRWASGRRGVWPAS